MYHIKPHIVGEALSQAMRLLESSKVRVVKPIRIMSLSTVMEGLEMLQNGEGAGKLVFRLNGEDNVWVSLTSPVGLAKSDRNKAVPPKLSFSTLRSNATYVLPGGLGGLGRSLAASMIEHGATHLIFTSRRKMELPDFMDELSSRGAKVMSFNCDISDATELRKMLAEVEGCFPPIKGVVNLAMHLQVLFRCCILHVTKLTSVSTSCLKT